MKLTINGQEITCAKAEKGTDFIRLYDDENRTLVEFSGINNFEGYTLVGGAFQNPPKTETEILQQQVNDLNMAIAALMGGAV